MFSRLRVRAPSESLRFRNRVESSCILRIRSASRHVLESVVRSRNLLVRGCNGRAKEAGNAGDSSPQSSCKLLIGALHLSYATLKPTEASQELSSTAACGCASGSQPARAASSCVRPARQVCHLPLRGTQGPCEEPST